MDMDARDVAARIDTHEKVCAERWTEIRRQLGRLEEEIPKQISRIEHMVARFWWLILVCAGTLICGMGGLLATLLTGHRA